ncbi:hypothetical protein AGDE_12934 [Angomonas deanei]|uniref:R3H domain containing protein, putative n=1 Tax=Angomonas deanei TaxID=59799 RepID=A0A7G2CKL7_9TRYP|nr:hypothetical protein AGDE_12934 [Angomonas deanei]CAD2218752.1 R3H domain containing protein, putative [Angomonas deanei]|eukprot:EPY23232.1 hypothetical protein AGDE_12934 [Angomonas deanei]
MSEASSRNEVLEAMRKAREALKSRTAVVGDGGEVVARTFAEDLTGNQRLVGRVNNALNAKDNLKEFLSYYYKLFQQFITDRTKFELELPNLTANDRRVLHFLANSCNLGHESKGQGEKRAFFLKKDTIFYGKQDMYLNADLEDIAKNVVSKTSKYEIRFVHQADPTEAQRGAIGSYDDEVALDGMLRMQRAADEYRNAVRMGTTTEELVESEQPGKRLEDILKGDTNSPFERETPRAVAMKLSAAKTNTAVENTTDSVVTVPTTSGTTVHYELCRSCGSKSLLTGDVSQWSCSKHCSVCGRETIWALEEVRAAASKRARAAEEEEEGTAQDEEALEIDREEEEPYELDDMLEMMALNDYCTEDIDALRHLGDCFPAEERVLHLLFLSDWTSTAQHPLIRQHKAGQHKKLKQEGEPPVYVVLRESTAVSKRVTALLTEMLSSCFVHSAAHDNQEGAPALDKELPLEEAARHAVVVCPVGSSVYGKEAVLLLQLQPSGGTSVQLSAQALEDLTRKYGSRHVFSSKNLSEAIKHVDGNN